jgi:hypothetical protein
MTVAAPTRRATCDDCYFRKTELCALSLPRPCPTFRPMQRGRMVPPPQARLVEPVRVAVA